VHKLSLCRSIYNTNSKRPVKQAHKVTSRLNVSSELQLLYISDLLFLINYSPCWKNVRKYLKVEINWWLQEDYIFLVEGYNCLAILHKQNAWFFLLHISCTLSCHNASAHGQFLTSFSIKITSHKSWQLLFFPFRVYIAICPRTFSNCVDGHY